MKLLGCAVFCGLSLIRISIPLALAIEGHCVANCGDGSSSSTQSAGSGNSYVSSPTWYPDPEQERKLELERIRSREAEKAHRQAEAQASELKAQRQIEEAQRQRKLEWEKNKDEALRSLKSSAHGSPPLKSSSGLGLKSSEDDSRRLQEDYYKTFKSGEVPSPRAEKIDKPFQFKKLKEWPQVDRVIDFANKVSVTWHEAKLWVKEKIQTEIKTKLIGGIKARSKIFSYAKDMKEKIEHLYETIGGEHKRTVTGLLQGMEQGVRETASPAITGNADEKMDAFIGERLDTYDTMAKEEIKSIVEGKLEELESEPEDPLAFQEEQSTTTPLLGLKSYDRQRAEALNQAVKRE